jgi:hypothetical protein
MGLIGQAVRSVDESPGLLRLVGVRVSAMKSARGGNPTMTRSPTSQTGRSAGVVFSCLRLGIDAGLRHEEW